MSSAAVQKNVMTFVKSRTARSDAEIARVMARQAAAMAGIERTRGDRGVSVDRFAAAAGISARSYYRALSGLVVIRAGTLAKLRIAQRRAAAGYLA